MARFPVRETDVVSLAQDVISGFTHHADVFPEPPVPADTLRGLLDAYSGAREAVTAAEVRLRDANAAKLETLGALSDKLKFALRYAEHVVADDQQLSLVGWSGRRDPTPLQPPGQCLAMTAARRGDGLVFLDWKEPMEGGKPVLYQVERRELPDGVWAGVATAIESEISLADQPRGKTLEYRVYAVNKAGNGVPGNVVDILL